MYLNMLFKIKLVNLIFRNTIFRFCIKTKSEDCQICWKINSDSSANLLFPMIPGNYMKPSIYSMIFTMDAPKIFPILTMESVISKSLLKPDSQMSYLWV